MKIDLKTRNPYFGIGMEKLDRDAFNAKDVLEHIAVLGVKWVRIQSGWAKTEKEKGIYNFRWLDEIVDGLTERDLTPWMCLCYGNPLYDERAGKIAGAVGWPPLAKESTDAWLAYCAETTKRYRGKVEYYEIWNEPEWLWGGKTDPVGYTAFCKRTSEAIKRGDPDAKIIVGSVASIDPAYLTKCLEEGIGENADALSYHAYTYDEKTFGELNVFYRELCEKKGKDLKVIHGESGSQSKNGGNGAFKGLPTDPAKQAKHLLRQMVTDRLTGAFFSSYFTATDMHENLEAKAGKRITKHGYFGVLSASFDKNGIACAPFTPKPSYRALQNVCAFFSEEVKPSSFPFWIDKKRDRKRFFHSFLYSGKRKPIGTIWHDIRKNDLVSYCLSKADANAFVYWESTDLINKRSFSSRVNIRFYETREPRLVDLMTGEISTLPYEKRDGFIFLSDLPVRDYPLAVVFGDFVE